MRGCTGGEERFIRQLVDFYNSSWATYDAVSLAGLFSESADIVHPDGVTERGRMAIQQNRTEQFMRREFSSSKHTLRLGMVRCLSADVAIADGKWELRGARDRTGNVLPQADGLVTLTVRRDAGPWLIEAYRYTVNQASVAPPLLLKKPGYPEIIK